jgi:hypothetical protein
MADSGDIQIVRRQTGQSENAAPFDDAYIGSLIDELGITGSTISIYEQLMAEYAKLVDTTEAGASHKFSDLYKNAKLQADYYRGIYLIEIGEEPDRTRVKKIVRTS